MTVDAAPDGAVEDLLRGRLFVAPADAARVLGVDRRSVHRAISAGQIPATRVGQQWRIATAWLRSRLPVEPDRGSEPGSESGSEGARDQVLAHPAAGSTPRPVGGRGTVVRSVSAREAEDRINRAADRICATSLEASGRAFGHLLGALPLAVRGGADTVLLADLTEAIERAADRAERIDADRADGTGAAGYGAGRDGGDR